jgi:PAS domain S-box-containing protein
MSRLSSPPAAPPADASNARRHEEIIHSIDRGFCIVEVLFDATGRATDYRFLETNAAFAEQTGLKNAAGRLMRELAPNHEQHWFDLYGEIALTGRPNHFVQEASALEGRWYDVFAFRIDEPKLHHVAILLSDITDRVHAEQAARLLADVGDALVTLHREEDLPAIIRAKAATFFQASQCALMEIDVRQHLALVHQSWDDPIAPPVGGAHRFDEFVTEALWQAVLAGQLVVVDDVQRDERIKDANRFRAFDVRSFLVVPLRRHDAWRHVFMLSRREPSVWRPDQVEVARELAARCWTRIERLRDETALRDREERLRLILENAREYAIFSMDLDRHVTSWSEGAAQLLGYTAEEMMGQSGDIVFVPEDRGAGAPGLEAARTLAEGRAANERWHIRKDGTRFWGSGAMMAMRDDRGVVTGLLKIMRDQTAVRITQQELEQSQARLQAALELAEAARADAEAAGRAKDRFLAALSHELRTPLNPVLMVAGDRAADPSLPAAVRADFEMIQKNIEHEGRLIEDMLDLNLITRGKLILRETRVDLHALLSDTLNVIAAAAACKDIALSFNPAAPQAEVQGDAARLKQIFLNLLNNAVKFTPPSGRVSVMTHLASDNEITVDIADTGLGLTDDELTRVFEPFVQGHHAGPGGFTSFGGLGLGLAIVRDLVTRHRGRVTARSEGRGRGATFSVVLPLSVERAAPPPTDEAAKKPEAGGRRILLAEDHDATRQALARILTARNHSVVAVRGKQEAVTAARRQEFDLVVSDLGLPDGNGYELFGEVRAIQPHLRGIALSGFGMEADLKRSAEAGFAAHLVKPVAVAKLTAAIAQVSPPA